MQNLGKKGRDKITGFEGIIVSKIFCLFGCAQYGIAGTAYNEKEGKRPPTEYFDEGRVEITGEGIKPEEVKSESGDGPDFNFDIPV